MVNKTIIKNKYIYYNSNQFYNYILQLQGGAILKTLLKKFYSNDENFIKSWEKTQKNGILIFISKTCILTTPILG